jgi:hypothetical protein
MGSRHYRPIGADDLRFMLASDHIAELHRATDHGRLERQAHERGSAPRRPRFAWILALKRGRSEPVSLHTLDPLAD